jgi:hypothetical protein
MWAAAQAAAYLRVHTSDGNTNLSAMTVASMFSDVTHSGVSSTDVTDSPVCGSVTFQLTRLSGGVIRARTCMASAALAVRHWGNKHKRESHEVARFLVGSKVEEFDDVCRRRSVVSADVTGLCHAVQ